MTQSTKDDVTKYAGRVFGPNVYTVAAKTPWNTWRIRLMDRTKDLEDGRLLIATSDHKALSHAYGELKTRILLVEAERAASREVST